ncbi:MAG: hypothetical protein OXU67_03670, partial [Chloroflexota bacterium]|nr:hypothetical protein [Chloroflexota bacterium]
GSPGRDDDLVARIGVDRPDADMHGRGAGVDPDGVLYAVPRGELPLEIPARMPAEAGAQHVPDGGDILVAKLVRRTERRRPYRCPTLDS